MSNIEVNIIPVLSDNYTYIVLDKKTSKTAVIDPALSEPVMHCLHEKKHRLTYILNTHHQMDHVGGNIGIKQKTGCAIIGYEGDERRIPSIDIKVKNKDSLKLGESNIKILHLAGHTSGSIAFHFTDDNIVFVGDTLFTMGCGRLFEGTAEELYNSTKILASLPKNTQIYSGHEYAEANARFALTLEQNNEILQKRFQEVISLNDKKVPIQPTTISLELQTNPFLRCDSLEIRKTLNMENCSDLEVFTKIRQLKDEF